MIGKKFTMVTLVLAGVAGNLTLAGPAITSVTANVRCQKGQILTTQSYNNKCNVGSGPFTTPFAPGNPGNLFPGVTINYGSPSTVNCGRMTTLVCPFSCTTSEYIQPPVSIPANCTYEGSNPENYECPAVAGGELSPVIFNGATGPQSCPGIDNDPDNANQAANACCMKLAAAACNKGSNDAIAYAYCTSESQTIPVVDTLCCDPAKPTTPAEPNPVPTAGPVPPSGSVTE